MARMSHMIMMMITIMSECQCQIQPFMGSDVMRTTHIMPTSSSMPSLPAAGHQPLGNKFVVW
jgi:hypothetical protein